MSPATQVEIGRIRLKNPLIAGSAEHLIEADGVRAALRAGAGAVVVKSTNRSQAARDQLQRAEYMVLDADWRPVAWGPPAPAHAFIACRSGLTPQSFDAWLAQTIALDREAKALDAYAVASLIFDEIGSTVEMARAVEQAGVRMLELNIGTPYASQAAEGAVSTELHARSRDPAPSAAAVDQGEDRAVSVHARSLSTAPRVAAWEGRPLVGCRQCGCARGFLLANTAHRVLEQNEKLKLLVSEMPRDERAFESIFQSRIRAAAPAVRAILAKRTRAGFGRPRSAPWIVARPLVEKSPVFFLLFTGRPILLLAVVA
jgi:hypothetical protein